MSFEKSMGVLEAEKRVIDAEADATIAKATEMGASPEEMQIAGVIGQRVSQLIETISQDAAIIHQVDAQRIHQLVLFLCARCEQAVSNARACN